MQPSTYREKLHLPKIKTRVKVFFSFTSMLWLYRLLTSTYFSIRDIGDTGHFSLEVFWEEMWYAKLL